MNSTMTMAAAFAAAMVSVQAGGESLLLKLTPESTYQQGCFPPCRCPVLFSGSVAGTMVLTPRVLGGTVDIYDVSDVNWQVDLKSGSGPHFTGSGTYTRFKEFAALQQLELDLASDDDITQHFDSGMVPIAVAFPQIDVTVSINGKFCFDTVIQVAAGPTGPQPADLNGDGHVDGFDLALLLGAWGNCPIDSICGCPADLDCSGWIDGLDLGILLGAWG